MEKIWRLSLLASAAVLLAACGGGSDSDDDKPTFNSVTYSVKGSAGSAAVVTYRSSGATNQLKVTLPWSGPIGMTAKEGDFLYVSAQNQSGLGSITTSISVNGETLASSTSTASYGVATADATCCHK